MPNRLFHAWVVSTIVDDCRLLACHFQNLQFAHIRREANQTMHYLAKYTSSHNENVWIEDAPNCIDVVFTFDLLPTPYNEFFFHVKKKELIL